MARSALLFAFALAGCDANGLTPSDDAALVGSIDAGADSAQAADLTVAAPQPPPPLMPARNLIAGAVDAKGRVYAIGGFDQVTGVTGSGTQIYTPAGNQWSAAAKMQFPRDALAATTGSDGRIYALGGRGLSNSALAAAEVYSPDDNQWSELPDLPTARIGLAAASDGKGRIYAIGGSTSATAPDKGISDAVEVYTIAGGKWSAIAKLPTPRLALAAVAGSDGKIYAIGGRDANNLPLDVVEVLDPDSGQWSAAPHLLNGRYWLAATVAPDGAIYVLGGIDGAEFSDAVEAFTAGAWVARAPMPSGRTWHAAATGGDGRLYGFGGAIDQSQVADPSVWSYTPALDSWTH